MRNYRNAGLAARARRNHECELPIYLMIDGCANETKSFPFVNCAIPIGVWAGDDVNQIPARNLHDSRQNIRHHMDVVTVDQNLLLGSPEKKTKTWDKTSGFDRFRAVAKNEKKGTQTSFRIVWDFLEQNKKKSRIQTKEAVENKVVGFAISWSRFAGGGSIGWQTGKQHRHYGSRSACACKGPFIQGCLFVNFKWVHR